MMTCTELAAKLDDYVDGLIDPAESVTLAAHIGNCADCRQLLEREHNLRRSLKDYGESSMPHADAAFFDQALLQAAQQGTRRQRNRWVMTGVGGTIAAGLVLWMLGGMFLNIACQCNDDRGPATGSRSAGICRSAGNYLDDQPYRRQERVALNAHSDFAAWRRVDGHLATRWRQ
jgi:hypothetical protein